MEFSILAVLGPNVWNPGNLHVTVVAEGAFS